MFLTCLGVALLFSLALIFDGSTHLIGHKTEGKKKEPSDIMAIVILRLLTVGTFYWGISIILNAR